jgi:alanine racemase
LKNHFPNSYADIDLHKILNNLKAVRNKAGTEKVLAVVKCDAYRHGAVRVSKHIEEEADWFAVATVDEGIQLRMGGVKKPVLVFGVPDYETAAAYHTHNLTATVSHKTHFDILMDGTRYHLNFDTGMGRLGFMPEQAGEVRQLAILNQRLSCSGIYSHYATADDPGSDFVEEQQKRFREILSNFAEIPLKHMSNTGAAANYDLDHLDMVRTGLGLLGYNPGTTRHSWLEPALTWKSRVVQVRKIRKGTPVSYSSSWKAPHDGYLATIPVGYGDGIPRSISNKLRLLINGEFYPQSGNVTMDYIMVFLGDRQVPVETEITLLGGGGLNAQDWAESAGTNAHEILTNLTGRVEKVYTDY